MHFLSGERHVRKRQGGIADLSLFRGAGRGVAVWSATDGDTADEGGGRTAHSVDDLSRPSLALVRRPAPPAPCSHPFVLPVALTS